ncbi:MAG: PepSY-like domain-containing protein [Paludibacteraceae bacterium]|nr:PepSY-like domain-containing protein [Paludibacteraceae bacterium]
MKKLLLTSTLFVVGMTLSFAVEQVISFGRLPEEIQVYTRKYFPAGDDAYRNAFITYDNELPEAAYTIVFTSGDGLEFRENKELKLYSAKTTTVPWEVMPAAVAESLGKSYPTAAVKKYEVVYVTLTTRQYEVELTDGTQLVYNEAGELVTQ